jgi:hypothetical protein
MMRGLTWVLLSGCVLTASPTAFADNDNTVDCARKSLADAVRRAEDNHDENQTIRFTGVCGPVVIRADGIKLKGVGEAVIDGGAAADAVTVKGASRTSIANAEIRNGLSGILAIDGAHISLADVNVHDNFVFGISLQTASSASLSDVTTNHNGVHGLDVETGSAANVTGAFTASNNRVFGINVNGSSITFEKATATVSGNAVGAQIATSANAFLNDSATSITASNNLAVGLTVVSGAHLVSFGGTINASGHPVVGVSVNSKAGLDLDAGSTLNTSNNIGDGLLMQEASVMTVFNNPQFSGVPGFSTINAQHNGGSGVRVQTGSTLTLSNQARVVSTSNGGTGLLADNGVGVTLVNSMITGNVTRDIQLTFGARADLQTLTFGTYTCDPTVLVRGTSGIVCPH